MGIHGTGYAAFVTYSFIFLLMLYFTNNDDILKQTNVYPDKRMFSGLNEYIKIGFPATVMTCLSWWAWEINLIYSGLFGVTQ